MQVKPVSAIKATMPAVLRELREKRQPILMVSKGKPAAVLQDVASYEETQNAIALLKIVLQSERDIAEGRISSTKEVMGRLRARVRARFAKP